MGRRNKLHVYCPSSKEKLTLKLHFCRRCAGCFLVRWLYHTERKISIYQSNGKLYKRHVDTENYMHPPFMYIKVPACTLERGMLSIDGYICVYTQVLA